MTTSIGTPSPADAQSADLGCRKLGATDIATGEQRQTLTELARQHTELALGVLLKIAQEGKSEKARVGGGQCTARPRLRQAQTDS